MGGPFDAPSCSFSCEMRIIQAKNMDTLCHESTGRYFVRLILSAAQGRLIRLETREVPLFNSTFDWNESFALQCSGSEESIELLKHQTVAFELRCRNKAPGLGRLFRTGSKLLGRVKVPWKEVFESPHSRVDAWAKLVLGDSCLRGCNDAPSLSVNGDPSLRIAIKFSVNGDLKGMTVKKGQEEKARNCYECCCDDCTGYISTWDNDIFAIVAALDAL